MSNHFTTRKWGEVNAPCADCQLRFVGCHSDCPKDKSEEYNYYGYNAFKAKNDREREIKVNFLKVSDMLCDIHKKGRKR